MRRSTGVIVFLLVLFFLFKVLRFQTLAYNFLDMYVFLQMATGWIDGRPFMYDNYWGDHQRIHNYYTMWLLGPLCYQWGAYALFLVQALLLLIACALTNGWLIKAGTPNWTRYGLLAVVLLGPTSGWLNDHTHMGWHVELTYLPLGLLFALALMRPGWGWPLVAGLGLTLVKEDGAVLAATIHLGYLGITYLKQYPNRSLWRLVTEPRFWFISVGWGLVFLAGMVWLAYLNHFAEPRLRVALAQIVQNIDTGLFWQQTGREAGTTLLLLLPAVCFMGWLNWSLPRAVSRQLIVFYSLGIIGLSALNFVQSSFYYNTPSGYHLLGLTWPPRFILPWTFTAAFLTVMLLRMPPADRPFASVPAWLVIGGLVLIQLPILRIARPDVPGLAESKAMVRGQPSPFKESRYVDPVDLAQLQCLATQLPPRSTVVAFTDVMPFFHKHYLVWQTGRQYRPADLALIPVGAKPEFRAGLRAMRRPYRVIRLKGYFLYVAADYELVVQACVHAPSFSAR